MFDSCEGHNSSNAYYIDDHVLPSFFLKITSSFREGERWRVHTGSSSTGTSKYDYSYGKLHLYMVDNNSVV